MGRGNYSGGRRGATAGDPANIMRSLLPNAEQKTREIYHGDIAKNIVRAALQQAEGRLSRAAYEIGVSPETFLDEVQKYKLTDLIKREKS